MLIQEVHVRNFRSILDESFSCDRLTALVGKNGAGKSSFLRALEIFYDPFAKVIDEDFYAKDTAQDIEIAITFSGLALHETEFFSSYIDNGTLTVARVFSTDSGGKSATYHGKRLQNREFARIRGADGKRELTNRYKELQSNGKYASLPTVRSADQAKNALKQWERENPSQCSRIRDDGQFFGFTGVGQGYLGRHTRFIKIPAVRDASEDSTDKHGSCIKEIMDLVVRNALAKRQEVTTFQEQTQAKYREIFDPAKLPELKNLQTHLTQTLNQYAPDSRISLKWSDLDTIPIPMPGAEVKLMEDGYESAVQQTGHGLQRAFILTMLQHLIAAREQKETSVDSTAKEDRFLGDQGRYLPSLVLAIEEPELYQHPVRQRHLASVLLKLAKGSIPGVVEQTQVIYTTHAPLFVGLDRFDQIRLLRKDDGQPGYPKITVVAETTLDSVAQQLSSLDCQPKGTYTEATLRPRMQAVMTPWMNEGFFADVVVLVEGESDRLALLAVAEAKGYNLDSKGVCIIPCNGKNSMDRPAVVFMSFDIRTYLIWDNDTHSRDPEPDANRRLLKIVEGPDTDWPVGIWDTHACFDSNLESTLRREMSEPVFDRLLEQTSNEIGMKKNQALKNPLVLRRIIEKATNENQVSSTLIMIVEKIVAI